MDIHYGRKRSGIKRQLTKKINEWLSSIKDENVKKAAYDDVIVTGGAIASMLLGEKVNDYDVYFRTKETTELVAQYYVKQFIDLNGDEDGQIGDPVKYKPTVKTEDIQNIKGETEERVIIWMQSAGVAAEDQDAYHYYEQLPDEALADFAETLIEDIAATDKEAYRPVFLSQNAITLSDKMQLVIRFYGEPDQIHSNYDFVHAMSYWDHKKRVLHLPADALEALLSRTLIYKGSLYPIASIFRMKKFIERGWRITAGQQLKIMWQISEIDMTDMSVLREQLTGVDMAYMYELIQALSEVEADKINSTYIGEIIDRIFD